MVQPRIDNKKGAGLPRLVVVGSVCLSSNQQTWASLLRMGGVGGLAEQSLTKANRLRIIVRDYAMESSRRQTAGAREVWLPFDDI